MQPFVFIVFSFITQEKTLEVVVDMMHSLWGGFWKWKKVRDGKRCAFLNHVGNDPNSSHKINERACEDLMKQSQHIDYLLHKKTRQQVLNNRLQFQASFDVVKWLATQGCAFRGHDESSNSSNWRNFIELLKLLSFYNEDVKLVMENAPQNALCTSRETQKEILQVLANKARKYSPRNM
ncbi:hypothetical protein SLEP1_g2990 [Rubroshorea leprosula]|uniref:DUF4371 domain-containing protein n=1 Tax=Rubroshorea leprosula TaxID=152421 RepID=A0AAV5HUC1_9ROSI|nr:hypothetical protein SLEP1_g2990 [Rubroshorea leprosula]